MISVKNPHSLYSLPSELPSSQIFPFISPCSLHTQLPILPSLSSVPTPFPEDSLSQNSHIIELAADQSEPTAALRGGKAITGVPHGQHSVTLCTICGSLGLSPFATAAPQFTSGRWQSMASVYYTVSLSLCVVNTAAASFSSPPPPVVVNLSDHRLWYFVTNLHVHKQFILCILHRRVLSSLYDVVAVQAKVLTVLVLHFIIKSLPLHSAASVRLPIHESSTDIHRLSARGDTEIYLFNVNKIYAEFCDQ